MPLKSYGYLSFLSFTICILFHSRHTSFHCGFYFSYLKRHRIRNREMAARNEIMNQQDSRYKRKWEKGDSERHAIPNSRKRRLDRWLVSKGLNRRIDGSPACQVIDFQTQEFYGFSRPRDRVYLHHRRTKDSPVESFLETFAIIFAFHKDNYRHHPRFPLISLVNTRFQSYFLDS